MERVWAGLRPNLLAVDPELAPEAPAGVLPLTRAALAAIGVDDLAPAHATLAAYRSANSRNLVAMLSLLEQPRGTGAAVAAREPSEPQRVLPLADLRTLPAATRALLDEMSEPLVGGDEPRLVPSLLRHFAHEPALLALLWTAIRPATGGIEERAAAVRERARAEARELPYPAPPVDDATRAVCVRFAGAMSSMLVTGELLRFALP